MPYVATGFEVFHINSE